MVIKDFLSLRIFLVTFFWVSEFRFVFFCRFFRACDFFLSLEALSLLFFGLEAPSFSFDPKALSFFVLSFFKCWHLKFFCLALRPWVFFGGALRIFARFALDFLFALIFFSWEDFLIPQLFFSFFWVGAGEVRGRWRGGCWGFGPWKVCFLCWDYFLNLVFFYLEEGLFFFGGFCFPCVFLALRRCCCFVQYLNSSLYVSVNSFR